MSLYAKYLPAVLGGGAGGGSGTVTSVGLADGSGTPIYGISGSPVTGSGTLTFTLQTQSANLVFAGPTTGSAAQPRFRALVAADISSLFGNLTDVGTDGIVITGGTGAVLGSGTSIAQHVADTTHNGYLASADWNTFNGKGSGSVTSVAMTVPTFLSVSGSPITSSGTLAVSLSGTALPIANGGTGQTTAAAAYNALSPMTTKGDIEYDSAAGVAARLAIGSTGNVLTVAGGVPTWAAPATAGTVTSFSEAGPTGVLSGSVATSTTTPALTLTWAGTSGGIPYFSSTSAMASSALLTQYGVVYGGGAAAAPVSTAVGSASQALVSNGGASAPSFQGGVNLRYNTSSTSLTSGSYVTAKFTSSNFDSNSAYNTSTGVFTAPFAGVYLISASAAVSSSSTGTNNSFALGIQYNGSGLYSMLGEYNFNIISVTVGIELVGSTLISMAANDTVAVQVYKDSALSATALDGNSGRNWISIALMR